ncbi:hypothetical protein B0J14DRAFT_565025 [Halenospora varia]|nr:hypothetical protein B0J14DRAFT_565025 [Halenospora varia]
MPIDPIVLILSSIVVAQPAQARGGNRLKKIGSVVHYIHKCKVSGTSMIGDWPVTGKRIDTSVHSNADEDIFETEKQMPDSFGPRSYRQDLVGRGSGLFTPGSGQIDMLTELPLKRKHAVTIGTGSGCIGRVGKELGAFDSDQLAIIDLQEVANDLFGGDEKNAESVLASNSKSKADHARQLLGWDPRYGEEDFSNEIRNVDVEMFKGKAN